jgi:hypothetical protein
MATIYPIVFRTAGIDIGIYNLGNCVIEFICTAPGSVTVTPISWGNWDIAARKPRLDVMEKLRADEAHCCATVASGSAAKMAAAPPRICGKKAAFSHDLTQFYCKTHAQQIIKQTAETTAPIVLWTGPITIQTLRKACREVGVVPIPMRKEDMVRGLATHFIFPSSLAKSVTATADVVDTESETEEPKSKKKRISDKVAKKTKPSLDEIEAGAEFFLGTHEEFWSCAGLRIENQGAAHGASTKSLQIMLYTLLKHGYRARDGTNIHINCINAEDKTREYEGAIVAVTGHKGYSARKLQAKEMVLGLLAKTDAKWLEIFEANCEKSDDMADAFLMAYKLGMSMLVKDGHIRGESKPAAVGVGTRSRRNILPAMLDADSE